MSSSPFFEVIESQATFQMSKTNKIMAIHRVVNNNETKEEYQELRKNHAAALSSSSTSSKTISSSTFSFLSFSTSSFDITCESKQLFHIALPTVAVQFCTFIMFPITASYIGRNLSSTDMAAFSLASLSGNMTCTSIIIGTLSASETLQPRAYALKQYEKVGILAIRGFIMCVLSLLLPIMFLLFEMDVIYHDLGQDAIVSQLAITWINVFIWSVPFNLLFRIIQRFLSCQNVVLPCVVGAFISSVIIHPLCLAFWIQTYGFPGSAMSIATTQCIQLLLTLIYIKCTKQSSYKEETWNGISWKILKEAVYNVDEVLIYIKLALGGIFALSEWWYWESIGFVAGRLGVLSLCVHSIINQLIPLVYMIPLGVSIGLSVRIGQLLPVDVTKAQILAFYTMIFVIIAAFVVMSNLSYHRVWIISLFTTDEDVINGCEQIWGTVCSYILSSYIFCLSSGIMRALGLQWMMGKTILLVLWCFSLPSIIYYCIVVGSGTKDFEGEREEGVVGLAKMWTIVFWSYILLDVGLIYCFVTADWHGIGRKAAGTSATSQETADDLSHKQSKLCTEESSLISFGKKVST